MKTEVVIAEGANAGTLVNPTSLSELPEGTYFDIIIHTSIPVAPLADLFGAEQFATALFDIGGTVIDVEGKGWSKIVVHCHGSPIAIPLLIGLIGLTVGGSVLALWVTSIIVRAFIEDVAPFAIDLLKYGSMSAVALGGTYIAVKRYS